MLITFFFMTCVLLLETLRQAIAVLLRSDRRAAFASCWNDPRLFLAPALPDLRARLSTVFLWLGMILLFAEDLLTLLVQQFVPFLLPEHVSIFVSAAICLLFVARLSCMSFSLRQLALLAPLFILAWVILLSTPGNPFAYGITQPVCLLLFFMHAPLRSVIKTGLGIKAAYMVLTITLCLAGRIPDHWNWLDDVGRYALGFGHFNVLGIAVVEFLLLYVCLRFTAWRWWDSLLLVAAAVFILLVPVSRTSFLLVLVLLALVLAARYLPGIFRSSGVQCFLASSWALSAAFSLLAGWFYGSVPFLDKLNALLSGRLFLMHQQMLGPAVRLFGAVSNGTMSWDMVWSPECWTADRLAGLYNYNFLDNGYAFCLYMAGPIFLAALCIGYGLLIRRFFRSGFADWPLAFMLIVMALYTVTQRVFDMVWIAMLLGNLWAERPLSLARKA